jgi:hypothetical protein
MTLVFLSLKTIKRETDGGNAPKYNLWAYGNIPISGNNVRNLHNNPFFIYIYSSQANVSTPLDSDKIFGYVK